MFKDYLSEEEFAFYERRGYFSREIVSGLHVLHLNTMIYSPNHTPATNNSDPFEQFAWMRKTLQSLKEKGHYAYITGHIPPALDTYGLKPQWEQIYIDQYLDIASKYSSVVASHLFGHIHSSAVRALPQIKESATTGSTPWQAPLFTLGAVSPVYNNNPSFRVVSYRANDDARIQDFAQYTFDITTANSTHPPKWHPLFKSFKNQFELKSLNNKDVASVSKRLLVDNTLWKNYLTFWDAGYFPVGVSTSIDASGSCENQTCRQAQSCGIISWSENAYQSCMNTTLVN